MNNRLAKFEDLIPSTLPFVEGKLVGHKERKNYSIVGPGVAEDSKQFIKIAMPHTFNLGAVSAMPKNGSGLHSHTTAEVFIIFSGKWTDLDGRRYAALGSQKAYTKKMNVANTYTHLTSI